MNFWYTLNLKHVTKIAKVRAIWCGFRSYPTIFRNGKINGSIGWPIPRFSLQKVRHVKYTSNKTVRKVVHGRIDRVCHTQYGPSFEMRQRLHDIRLCHFCVYFCHRVGPICSGFQQEVHAPSTFNFNFNWNVLDIILFGSSFVISIEVDQTWFFFIIYLIS